MYWGLVCSMSDVIVGLVSDLVICSVLGFFFFFFFFFENPFVCYLYNLLDLPWAWLCYNFFFFLQILVFFLA